MKWSLAIAALLAIVGAHAAETFPYDRQLALDLSGAYLRAYSKQNPDKHLDADTLNPVISSAIAKHHRHLVFITYSVKGTSAGNYVVLELCAETNLLTVVEEGVVDPLSAYKHEIAEINSKTSIASPAVCPAEIP